MLPYASVDDVVSAVGTTLCHARVHPCDCVVFFTRLSHYPARSWSDGPLTVRRAHDYGVCVFNSDRFFSRLGCCLVVAWLLLDFCLLVFRSPGRGT